MITANAALDMMRSHEWVQGLPWHHIEKLAKLAEERHFEPSAVLFHQGDLRDRLGHGGDDTACEDELPYRSGRHCLRGDRVGRTY